MLIVSTQIKDFLGLRMAEVPSEFVPRLRAYWQPSARRWTALALALGAISLAVVILTPKLVRRVPGQIVALLLATAAVALFALPVETIGTRFGGIPSALPRLPGPGVPRRPDRAAPARGAHRRDSGRRRKPALGRRRRLR